MLEGDFWGTSKSKGLVARHELGSVPLSYTGRALKVGGETIWVHSVTQGDAEALAALSAS